MAHRLLRILIAVPILWTLHACTPHTPRDIAGAESFGATSVVVDADSLYPDLLLPGTSQRAYTDEKTGTPVIERTLAEPESELGGWRRIERLAADSGDQSPAVLESVRILSRNEDGEILLVRSINAERGLELVYEPPLAVAPAELRYGEAYEARSGVREPAPETRSAEQTGSAVYTLELLGERDGGSGRELLIRSSLEIRLGRSVVRRTTDRLYRVCGDGSLTLDLEAESEAVTAMGFTVSRSERSLRPSQE